jgi:beta-galactosidase
VVRAILSTYGRHPALIGVQVDNEPGLHLPYNRSTFERFLDHLRTRYGDVDTLNQAWGLTYWSHRLSSWGDLWRPEGNTFPQYDLAWRRYQAALTTEFIGAQAAIAREYLAEGRFVTTCIAYSRPAVADDELVGVLDVTAANIYYGMGSGLARVPEGRERRASQGWAPVGVDSLFFAADRAWSSGAAPFLVTETDAASIGGAHMNWPPYDGQLRQAAWALIARGARSVEYWHWHTIPYGAETYWGGVLPHSLRPGRIYEEVVRLGAELASTGDLLAGLEPEGAVALVWSNPSKWAMEFVPPLADSDGQPDPRSYERIVRSFYDGVLEARMGCRIINARRLIEADPAELATRHPVLVAAGLYVADDIALGTLRAYAEAGGHLVIGIRTGYADDEARVRPGPPPGPLAAPAGVSYDEYANLTHSLPIVAPAGSALKVPEGAAATAWVDGLLPEGADVLASYEHPHFGRWPAVTSQVFGRGRVTYVGTVPNLALATALVSWAMGEAQGADAYSAWTALPPTVTSSGARNAAAQRLRFLHNWSWVPATVVAPVPVRDALSGAATRVGGQLFLAPWDVRVLVEEPVPPTV